MQGFHLQLVTPDGLVFDGIADAIMVRTIGGDVEIMRGHEDYFATLGTGRARLTVNGEAKDASAAGGFISVKGGEVKLVCTTFEFAENIDIDRARLAKEKSEAAIANAKDADACRIARAKLARATSRINVAELLK